MNVILVQDVEKLGLMGDEVQVADGYARNYLIPKKIAMQATPGALQILEKKKKERQRLEEKKKAECEKFVEKIEGSSCTITVKAGEGDKLFGSVSPEMIAEALLAEGIEIDKKRIILDEPIKALGVYNVSIKLHPEVATEIRVWVVKK